MSEPETGRPISLRKRLKRIRRKITYSEIFFNTVGTAAALLIYLYIRTLKVRFFFNSEILSSDRTRMLYGFWHGRQLLLVPHFGPWHTTIITDLSWAGEIQSRILSRWGYRIVRGSSKHQGVQALIDTKRSLELGYSATFAMDGPSGPVYKSKPGIVFLAKKMGYPIVPVIASAESGWILKKTWCSYLLPKPFSRCLVAMGKPIRPDEAGETLTTELVDAVMMDWMRRVDGIWTSAKIKA